MHSYVSIPLPTTATNLSKQILAENSATQPIEHYRATGNVRKNRITLSLFLSREEPSLPPLFLRRFATIYKLRDKSHLRRRERGPRCDSPVTTTARRTTTTRTRTKVEWKSRGRVGTWTLCPERRRKDEKGERRERERERGRRGGGGRKRIKTLAAGRALTITIIYARGALTLTFNVPPLLPWKQRYARSRYVPRAHELLPLLEKLILLGWIQLALHSTLHGWQ